VKKIRMLRLALLGSIELIFLKNISPMSEILNVHKPFIKRAYVFNLF